MISIEEKNMDVCRSTVIHEDNVRRAMEQMPEEQVLYDMAEFFKVLGDSTRMKIISALFESEMCVCDLSAALNMTQSAISHQLRVLKQANLVKFRREGKVVYYTLSDDHVKHIFDQGLVHIQER